MKQKWFTVDPLHDFEQALDTIRRVSQPVITHIVTQDVNLLADTLATLEFRANWANPLTCCTINGITVFEDKSLPAGTIQAWLDKKMVHEWVVPVKEGSMTVEFDLVLTDSAERIWFDSAVVDGPGWEVAKLSTVVLTGEQWDALGRPARIRVQVKPKEEA
jgi:hypothetical protein